MSIVSSILEHVPTVDASRVQTYVEAALARNWSTTRFQLDVPLVAQSWYGILCLLASRLDVDASVLRKLVEQYVTVGNWRNITIQMWLRSDLSAGLASIKFEMMLDLHSHPLIYMLHNWCLHHDDPKPLAMKLTRIADDAEAANFGTSVGVLAVAECLASITMLRHPDVLQGLLEDGLLHRAQPPAQVHVVLSADEDGKLSDPLQTDWALLMQALEQLIDYGARVLSQLKTFPKHRLVGPFTNGPISIAEIPESTLTFVSTKTVLSAHSASWQERTRQRQEDATRVWYCIADVGRFSLDVARLVLHYDVRWAPLVYPQTMEQAYASNESHDVWLIV